MSNSNVVREALGADAKGIESIQRLNWMHYSRIVDGLSIATVNAWLERDHGPGKISREIHEHQVAKNAVMLVADSYGPITGCLSASREGDSSDGQGRLRNFNTTFPGHYEPGSFSEELIARGLTFLGAGNKPVAITVPVVDTPRIEFLGSLGFTEQRADEPTVIEIYQSKTSIDNIELVRPPAPL